MSSELAIKIENISKCYQIYGQPQDRLKQSLYPRLQRLIGRAPKQYFQEFWAIKDISFEVKKGETVGIIGRNGSGKSTLLQMICGTLNPTSGRIQTNGRVAALLELGSGFDLEFTGRENVYMNAAILGLSNADIDVRYDDIISFADIGGFIDQPVKTYSSGMLVRLAFAVIAHVDANILVVDEALSVGDAFFTQKCMRFLRGFMKKGTVLFVSHDTSAVVNLCNKAMLLDQGVVKAQGVPKEITAQYLQDLYEARQGKSQIPEMAITEKEVHEDKLDCPEDDYRDMRLDFFNTTNLRNDVELFKFNPVTPSFGKGGASVEAVMLTDKNDKPLSWVVGGEMVKLKIYCKTNNNCNSPIIGFQLRDRLGQIIFGDVTEFAKHCKPLCVNCGQRLVAIFEFRFPVMPAGDYSITVAIAEGTLNEHIQHHWVHEALILRVHASSVCFGLIQVPVKSITLNLIN